VKPSHAPCPPAELLSELVGVGQLASACIPAAVRHADPEIEATARRHALRITTQHPDGDEDLVCAATGSSPGRTLREVRSAVARFERLPFVMLVAPHPDASDAVLVASSLLGPFEPWLARIDPSGAGAVLLAPEERLLSAGALPGEWQADLGDREQPLTGQTALATLWQVAERDREFLSEVAGRIEHSTQELEEANAARERLGAEVERLRAAERREIDRLRLEAIEQRAWVTEQATRLGRSTSWRVGHRLVRIARRLTLRSDKGTDLPAKIVERMQDGELR
jgi:hypothetical protein